MLNVVHLCLAANNVMILLMRKQNNAFSVLRSFLREKRHIASLSEDIHKKTNKLGDRMIKQLLKFGYRKIAFGFGK